METTKQSKEDYLKRYLSGYTEEKKKHKKKKKHSVIKPRTRIFDDDVDLSQLNPNSEDKDDVLFVDEAPQVAEVVDERPLEEIELEKYRTGKKWRIINDDEGENQINSDEEEKIRLDKKSYQNRRHDSDSDQSPPRKKNMRHDSDSDQSPPRKKNVRHDSDSDQSPTRKKNVRHDSDSDQSPPRKKNVRHDSDSDQSPPRKKNVRHGSDSDQSPPRKKQSLRKSRESDQSPRRKKKRQQDSGSDQSPPRRRKHLLDDKSKSAGLQDASSMRMENQQKRQSDKEALDRLDHETSGKNAGTVYRDKSGKKRDLHKEKLKHAEELKKEEEDSKQFKEWGKGVVQTKKHQETIVDHMKEMAKPFARYEGDRDLEGMLKNQEREGDPMLAFIKKKSARTNAKNNVPEKPKYKGRAPPPNRFNIPPGYRWDGVDRSNGFEKKHFERLSSKKAMEEVKYKWNVEDM
ncbi:uncharacterized protein [Antedon mediterranea]|uniref:uncharacterized protein isoform X2 n=1 Tax=Antedon mediterranea TaxID=105859 RepID=UPI003AF5FE0C